MTEAIIGFFRELFNNDYLTTFFISILPIVELRGAIPVGVEMGLGLMSAFGLAYIGSSIVVPFLLLLLQPILNLIKKVKIFARFANAVENMFKDKASEIAKKAGNGNTQKKEEWIKIIGIFAFVALPIPLTGVWTGSAIAVFLGLKFWKALPAILLGNFTAGAIVTLLSAFFSEYLDTILMVFFILVIILLVVFIVKIAIRMIKSKREEQSLKDIEDSNNKGESIALDANNENDSDTNSDIKNEAPDKPNDNDDEYSNVDQIVYGKGFKKNKLAEDANVDKK